MRLFYQIRQIAGCVDFKSLLISRADSLLLTHVSEANDYSFLSALIHHVLSEAN